MSIYEADKNIFKRLGQVTSKGTKLHELKINISARFLNEFEILVKSQVLAVNPENTKYYLIVDELYFNKCISTMYGKCLVKNRLYL